MRGATGAAASAGLTHARPAGPALTADGVAVRFQANIERLEEVEAARAAGAEGIGLFRSEFLLGGRAVDAFDEEAQYRRLPRSGRADGAASRDHPHLRHRRGAGVGAAPATEQAAGVPRAGPAGPARDPPEPGPSRGLRDAVARPRARRPSRGGPGAAAVRVERRRAAGGPGRAAIGHPRGAAPRGRVPAMPVGVMIEVPSAALDGRPAGRRGGLLQHRHQRPDSVLPGGRSDRRPRGGAVRPAAPRHSRVIRHVIRLARPRGRQVALCGEMAADPGALLLAAGAGRDRVQHEPGGHSRGARPGASGRRCARRGARRRARCSLPTSADIAALLAARFPALASWPRGRDGRPHMEGHS